MKTFKSLVILIFIIGIYSCDKAGSQEINNPGVENFINLLMMNQYDSFNLPLFTYKDIPALLQHRNDTQTISNYPHNPISSLWYPECKLGVYVLWTIESIRAVSINSKYLTFRYPSLNPILALRDSVRLDPVSYSLSHAIAAKAYYDWWESNKDKDYDDFKAIDPLEDTDYKWY